jgi:hypothetical protein
VRSEMYCFPVSVVMIGMDPNHFVNCSSGVRDAYVATAD